MMIPGRCHSRRRIPTLWTILFLLLLIRVKSFESSRGNLLEISVKNIHHRHHENNNNNNNNRIQHQHSFGSLRHQLHPPATFTSNRKKIHPHAASLSPVTTTTTSAFGAAFALVISSLFGMKLDRRLGGGGGASGILGSMVMASSLAFLLPKSILPPVHPFYDLCWTFFLPASLSFMLLAPPPLTTNNNYNDEKKNGVASENLMKKKGSTSVDDSSTIATCIRRVAGPFAIATIGSLVGCWTSFRVLLYAKLFQSIEQARLVASCVSASYVGGSINCFATARIVGAPSDLMSSLATADLLSMAIYFGCLSASLNWNWLRSKFRHNQRRSRSDVNVNIIRGDDDNTEKPTVTAIIDERMSGIAVSFDSSGEGKDNDGDEEEDSAIDADTESLSQRRRGNNKPIIVSSIPVIGISFAIVKLATRIEQFFSRLKIPGTACAVIAFVAPWLQQRLKKQTWWQPTKVASPIADFCFLLFFASIGITSATSGVTSRAAAQSYLSTGPACLIYSLLSVMIHFVITILGSLLLFKKSSMEDALIASNAAIGGPTTAAAFCQRMVRDNPSQAKMQGRTIAATVWGVVGYAVGTILGVALYKFLGGGVVAG